MANLILLDNSEFSLRVDKLRRSMVEADAIILSDNASIYYLTGRVFAGFVYIPLQGDPTFFVRRPIGLKGPSVVYIRKPEQMAEHVAPKSLALELDIAPYSDVVRLSRVFPEAAILNASPMMRAARAVKTPFEIKQIEASGIKQERVYRRLPHLFREGMTDLELQVEIERTSRLEGCLGQFRISGNSMELYMANILVGENADTPTPYDFAMGGEGLDPSLPVGANGTVIRPGKSIMVDANGNYTGYMTDMTRTFSCGTLPNQAMRAHQCSIDICQALAEAARPGVEAKALYELALDMATHAGLHEYFMGHKQKAGFVGHGLGIEINELPVIAPRSRDIIALGNVFALEPKFVIPEVGAVGVENTYVVEANSTRCLTNAPLEIINLE